ncbi:hypothetical protein [Nonomuraea sp. NPDC049625]|uniref:hypothetical protein n=1 Tax=Nonomuraea sp. NPDC049625 TaxID=3155775 RepID=UPI003416D54C
MDVPAKLPALSTYLGHREPATAHRYAVRGYLSTAAKHGTDVMAAIRDALLGRAWLPPAPIPA